MYGKIRSEIEKNLQEIRENGLYKAERVISGPQGSKIRVGTGSEVINMCANNYLGLASHPEVVKAAEESLQKWGYGLSSVRFICGTQVIHKELEAKISEYLETEDTILYTSCFDANGGLFETLLTAEDAIISDALNHASIIDGVRLCKAKRFVYKTSDLHDLEAKLKDTKDHRFRLIATDGVFSMDGTVARLKGIADLADRYDAMVMIDDSHGVGVLGARGRGSHEYRDVLGRIDIITGTLGKALGGASGGYTAGHREIVEMLRQRSRPYLFSNSLAPTIVAASLKALDILDRDTTLKDKLADSTRYFREKMRAKGFEIPQGDHPIVPIMLGDAVLAQKMAERLLEKGVYVIGFSYPVVPRGQARIRTQISAAHTREELDFVIERFSDVKEEFEV